MAFTDHIDIETFELLSRMDQGAIRDRMLKDLIDPAVLTHLADVRDAGSLAIVEGTENREIRLADAWNAFLAGTEILWQGVLAHGLSNMVLVYAITGRVRGEKADVDASAAMAESYASLCQRMDAGDLVGTTFHKAIAPQPFFDDLRCGATGERCRLVVENWRPRLERFDRQAKDDGYWVPLAPVAAPVVETVEIDLPTGVLLVCDYLRAPGIHEALEGRIDRAIGDRRYEETHSVNSERGRVAMTRVVAETSSMLQVCTTNTVVALHQSDDRLVVTDDHESVAGMVKTGTVICDRWTVLLADRGAVMDLMQDDGSVLDGFLASDEGGEITTVEVTPGRWRVSFGAALDAEAARAMGIGTEARVWFAMERIG